MANSVRSVDVGETTQIQRGLRLWLVQNVSEALDIDSGTMATSCNLEELGLDDVQALCIVAEMQEWLGLILPETLLEDYPTIDSACEYIMAMIPHSDIAVYSVIASDYIFEIESPGKYPRPSKRQAGGRIFTAP